MHLFDQVETRRIDGSQSVIAEATKQRLQQLDFSQEKSITSAHKGAITWFHLDQIDYRYLLSVAGDSSLAIYDTLVPTARNTDGSWRHDAVASIDKRTAAAHRLIISSACWYPVDTGLFATGSFDAHVKLWDTNALAQVAHFNLADKVYSVAMSPLASTHVLIAAGTAGKSVRLCDPVSGGFAHTLTAHRDGVWAVAWSQTSEYILLTGGNDGQVNVWDIRRAGVLHTLDQYQTQRRPPQKDRRTDARGITAARSSNPRRGGPVGPAGGPPAGAHAGVVTGIASTPEGLSWVTAGTDNRVRLWDADDYRHLLVHYPGTYNSAMKARQICTSDYHQLLFHPSGSVVQCFDLLGGQLVTLLRHHFDTVNACAYNPVTQELYTGANDCKILVWASNTGDSGNDSDQDNWSQ